MRCCVANHVRFEDLIDAFCRQRRDEFLDVLPGAALGLPTPSLLVNGLAGCATVEECRDEAVVGQLVREERRRLVIPDDEYGRVERIAHVGRDVPWARVLPWLANRLGQSPDLLFEGEKAISVGALKPIAVLLVG